MPPHGRERGARGLYVSEHPVAVPSPQEEIKDATQSIRRSAERRPASGRIVRARRDSTTSTGRPPARSPKSWQRIAVAPRSLLRSLRPRARRGEEAASSSRGQDGAGLAPKAEAAAQDRCQRGSRLFAPISPASSARYTCFGAKYTSLRERPKSANIPHVNIYLN